MNDQKISDNVVYEKIVKYLMILYSSILLAAVFKYHPPYLSIHSVQDRISFNTIAFLCVLFVVFFYLHISIMSEKMSLMFYFFLLSVCNPKIFVLFVKDGIDGPGIYASLLLFPILFFSLIRKKRIDIRSIYNNKILLYCFALMLWYIISCVFISGNLFRGSREVLAVCFFCACVLIGNLSYSKENENFLFKIFSVFSVIVTIYSLTHYFLMFFDVHPMFRQITLRSFGAFRNPNSLAAVLVLTFAFHLNGFSFFKKRIVDLLFLILNGLTLLSTGSRSGIVAYFLVFFLFLISRSKPDQKKKIFILSAVLAVLFVSVFTFSDFQFRMIGILARFEIIKKALSMYWNSNILLGIGSGSFRVDAKPYDIYPVSYVPNIFLHWWFVYGLPGIILGSLFVKNIFFECMKVHSDSTLKRSISLALAGILAIGMFENILAALFVNWIFGIMIGIISSRGINE